MVTLETQFESDRQERGAALAELALVMVFLGILLALVINFASILSQTQVMAEAARHGARTAATRSNDGVDCSDIADQAFIAANAYRMQYSSDATAGTAVSGSSIKEQWWEEPDVCLSMQEWGGVQERYIHVSFSTAGPTNCFFCFLNFFAYIPVTVSSVFKMEWGTCMGTSYDVIESSIGTLHCRP